MILIEQDGHLYPLVSMGNASVLLKKEIFQ